MSAANNSPGHPSERRRHPRGPGEAYAEVVRENDLMRLAVAGRLKDVSLWGVGLVVEEEFAVNEPVRITLINPLQKVRCQVRGKVKHATRLPTGEFQIGVELLIQLASLDLSLLRMGLKADDEQNSTPKWM